MRAQLYKVYIRPVVYYDIEACFMSPTDILNLKRLEGNIIKIILGINTKCKTTDLFNALKIDITRDKHDNAKVEFFLRLTQNEFTNELVQLSRRSGFKSPLLLQICFTRIKKN